jgi:zinc transport system ATP-binding protein
VSEVIDTAIEIKDLSVNLGGVQILHDVNVSIMRNKTTAIIGPNGAGKTTLLLSIMGMVPYSGTIKFYSDHKQNNEKPHIGYVPQRLDLDRGAPITVLDFISLKNQKLPLWLGHRKKVKEKVLASLERVGAAHLLKRPLGKLSGGEMQRVVLAMAIHNVPDIILLDEPSAGVDVAGEEIFWHILDGLQKEERFTLILISHDLSVVTQHTDRVICMNKTVRCSGTVDVLTQENLAAIYGIHVGLYEHGSCPLVEKEGKSVSGNP